MIFANIFYFFSAIIIIAFAPDKSSFIGFPLNIIWISVLIILFINYNKNSFLRLRRKYNKIEEKTLIKNNFNKAINSNMIYGLLVFSFTVFFFDLKFLLVQIPLIGGIDSLIDVFLLTFFLLFLSIVWYWSYKYFGDIYSLGNSAKAHISSNLKFNLAILIPWFIATVFENISSLIDIANYNEIKSSGWGYFLTMFAYLIIFLVFTPYLITKLWESEPLEEGELNSLIGEYCSKQKVKFKGILAWNALNKGLITAAVMGIIYPFRYLLLTPKLMDLLNKDEVLAVVSHEVGHVKKKHMFFYLGFFFSAMPVLTSVSSYIVQLFQITEPGRTLYIFFYEPNNVFLNILMILLTLFFFVLFFRYFFGYLMRNFERQADLYCFESGIEPEHLISSFEKLNLMINESKEKKNWHHFNIPERISFLKQCSADSKEIIKHNRKVKKSILLMGGTALLALFFTFNFIYSNNIMSEKEKLFLGIDIYENLIKKNPENRILYKIQGMRLYQDYGMFNYNSENWEEAINGYEKSLKIKFEQPQVLNNLAWLLLTCKDKKFRNKEAALKYSQIAWNLVKDENKISIYMFILDTLAESYYQNGLFDQAFRASKKARNFTKENKEYYERQYEKMKKARLRHSGFSETI